MNRVQADVDRGLLLRAHMKAMTTELEEITERLEAAGLAAPQQDLKDADREGRRWLARGTKCAIAILFTADKIVSEFTAHTAIHDRIKFAADGRLLAFFRPINKYKNHFDDGKAFRAAAAETLGAAAPGFVTACLARDKDGHPKSDIKILWDTPEPL